MIYVISKMFKPDIQIDSKELFRQKRADLGPMSREEKISAVAVIIIFLYIITANIHEPELAYVFVLLPSPPCIPMLWCGQARRH